MPEPLPQPKPEQKTLVKPSLFVNLESQYFGRDYQPVVWTESLGQLKIEYKNLNSGSGYSEEKPTAVGSYVVRVSLSGDEEFQENTIEKAFDIMFYPAPTVPYSFDGKSGDNGYFVSDVNIVAPEGYTISTSINGPFGKTVPYTGGSQQVYLKHSSGAITSYIAVNQELKIDTVKPVLGEIAVDEKENSVNLSEIVYADHISFNLLDDHLTSVTVNGKPVTVKDNQALVELDATGGKNTFTVTAIDEAGNEYTTEVKLYAAWLRDKVIPAGKKIRLEPGESYKLPSGRWRITGDSTIYNGGTDIYVNAGGEYTFEKVD